VKLFTVLCVRILGLLGYHHYWVTDDFQVNVYFLVAVCCNLVVMNFKLSNSVISVRSS
jgi:hypothetical protein